MNTHVMKDFLRPIFHLKNKLHKICFWNEKAYIVSKAKNAVTFIQSVTAKHYIYLLIKIIKFYIMLWTSLSYLFWKPKLKRQSKHWLSSKEKVPCTAFSKEAHDDNHTGLDWTHYNWFPWKSTTLNSVFNCQLLMWNSCNLLIDYYVNLSELHQNKE